MIRRRAHVESSSSSSSDEEEDAFTALERKRNPKRSKVEQQQPQQPTTRTKIKMTTTTTKTIADFTNDGIKSKNKDETFSSNNNNNNAVVGLNEPTSETPSSFSSAAAPVKSGLTSSMKRHHKPNDPLKAKMEALLQELVEEGPKHHNTAAGYSSASRGGGGGGRNSRHYIPEKKGSYVDPSEEHLTTNIFVGNLSPRITEEQMTDLFLQFGDLYSVKIMWPRTIEERNRNRNTGFVCFMNREDAEDAMHACNEADPFKVGRLLMMRWGKNVKKIVKRGTGGIAIAPIQQQQQHHQKRSSQQNPNGHDENEIDITNNNNNHGPQFQRYQSEKHQQDAIQVIVPSDPKRFHFISKIASFVAKDGSALEKRLIHQEQLNPQFDFMTLDPKIFHHQQYRHYQFKDNDNNTNGEGDTDKNKTRYQEHIFYRWRIYSFCQGDGYNNWRSEPFLMFYPHGKFWIPPLVNKEAARQETLREHDRQEMIRRQKIQRRGGRKNTQRSGPPRYDMDPNDDDNNNNYNNEGTGRLSPQDVKQFNYLVQQELTTSRKSICTAMSFCFEKSVAAKEISDLLRDALLEELDNCPIDTRIARLYLLSDVLYNSQQPGVRNAFLYRDAVEKMAPQVFQSLGKQQKSVGRLTMNKLRMAVSSVLGAWTDWSVYNPTFIDELQFHFEGKEIPTTDTAAASDKNVETAKVKEKQDNELPSPKNNEDSTQDMEETNEAIIINKPRGDWSEIPTDDIGTKSPQTFATSTSIVIASTGDGPASTIHVKSRFSDDDDDDDVDGVAIDGEELDGEPIEAANNITDHNIIVAAVDGEELDGEPIEEDSNQLKNNNGNVDGDPIQFVQKDIESRRNIAASNGDIINHHKNNVSAQRGVANDDDDEDDIDGEALHGEDANEEAVTSDVDGTPIIDDDDDDVDGAAIRDDDDVDGSPIDDNVDAEMDGHSI